jgi:hypothetical protein
MIEQKIQDLVTAHYRDPNNGVLMLSNIGARLSDENLWPTNDDNRSLKQILDEMPGITVVRDADARSFIAIVPKGEEARAHAAIEERHKLFFLRGLHRTIILAFTLDLAEGLAMYLRLTPRPVYQATSDAPDPDFILVEEEFRIPGLTFERLSDLEDDVVAQLGANIRNWCDHHSISPETLRGRRIAPPRTKETAPAPKLVSALERLYAAQPPELAAKIIVPMDIALTLSRMP